MDYKAFLQETNENNGRVMHAAPKAAQAFFGLYRTACEANALDAKVKALIALGISIAAKCEGCIAMHVAAAIEAGATMEEIADTVAVAMAMGGGPSLVHGGKAIACAEQLLGK